MLHTFGACASPSTTARQTRRDLAALKAGQEETLRTLSDDSVLVAAIDNCGKQEGSRYLNSLAIFLWAFRSTTSVGELPGDGDSTPSRPVLLQSDENELAKMNPIAGESALAEEMGNLKGTVVYTLDTASYTAPALPPARTIAAIAPHLHTLTGRRPEPFVGLEPVIGAVNDDNICIALNRIAQAGNVCNGRRAFVYIVCDFDIYDKIQAIRARSPDTYGWVRLIPAQWHISLCMRLTIGATWGKAFLATAVHEVEKCTANTARYLVSGVRWRRSGTIFFQAARGIVRALLIVWHTTQGAAHPNDVSLFRRWLAMMAKREQPIKLLVDFVLAVGLNLYLDLSVRAGNYDACIKCAHHFHALACSRGRFNYKELLGEQIVNWAECSPEERAAIARAAISPAENGEGITRDEVYEALLKLTKVHDEIDVVLLLTLAQAHLHPGLLKDEHLIRATLLASHGVLIERRAQLFLDWVLGTDGPTKARASTRPYSAASLKDREKINAYSAWFINWLQRPLVDGRIPTADGAVFPFAVVADLSLSQDSSIRRSPAAGRRGAARATSSSWPSFIGKDRRGRPRASGRRQQ